jgi:hypothetical protein
MNQWITLKDLVSGSTIECKIGKLEKRSEPSRDLIEFMQSFQVAVKDFQQRLGVRQPHYIVGNLGSPLYSQVNNRINDLRIINPQKKRSVFKQNLGVKEIDAGVWGSNGRRPKKRKPAIINMIFQSECGLLPLHIHPRSYRVIVILEGSGYGYFSHETMDGFSGKSITRVSLSRGAVLCYGGDTLHTFGTEGSEIELLTYHSRYFPFEGDEQCSIPANHWTPSNYIV